MMQTALRTTGIWIEEDHILLESLANREVWGIPGGRLEPEESAEAGCLREYREELGLEMQAHGLAILHENFWHSYQGLIREYCFYFRVRPQARLASGRIDIKSQEDQLQFRWFQLDELDKLRLVPPILRTVLHEIDGQTRFLSTVEADFEI
jgi:ADP-ribose pyrophosphatase YjhB (NUDIX family)